MYGWRHVDHHGPRLHLGGANRQHFDCGKQTSVERETKRDPAWQLALHLSDSRGKREETSKVQKNEGGRDAGNGGQCRLDAVNS